MLGAWQVRRCWLSYPVLQCETMQILIGVFSCALRQQKGVSQVREQVGSYAHDLLLMVLLMALGRNPDTSRYMWPGRIDLCQLSHVNVPLPLGRGRAGSSAWTRAWPSCPTKLTPARLRRRSSSCHGR